MKEKWLNRRKRVLEIIEVSKDYDRVSRIYDFTGMVDLLSFLPYYLPFFFPAGNVAFRMIRIVRIFRHLVGGIHAADGWLW